MKTAGVCAALLCVAACGGGGRVSSYAAVNAACIQQERDIVYRQHTTAAEDQAALDEVRRACDNLLVAIEHSR